MQRVCQHNIDFFNLWEAGKGPGQMEGLLIPHKRIASCLHRGKVLDERLCNTCAGKVLIKVFECHINDQCTLFPSFEGTTPCLTCEDHVNGEHI